jgi:hypothetical protein
MDVYPLVTGTNSLSVLVQRKLYRNTLSAVGLLIKHYYARIAIAPNVDHLVVAMGSPKIVGFLESLVLRRNVQSEIESIETSYKRSKDIEIRWLFQ